MIEAVAYALCRLARPSAVLAALLIWIGPSSSCAAQPAPGGRTLPPATPALNSETLSHLPLFLAEKYPTVRSLMLARGNCVAFEYYRKDIGIGTLSRVHSITKSVLSILFGIAIDNGYLRLDQKLSELLPETLEKTVDPRVRDITVRDLLTMTSGFDPAGQRGRIGVPTTERWQWMINRPMLYSPGSHFNYDDTGADFTSVVLKRGIGQNPGQFARQNLFDPMGIASYNWISDAEGNLVASNGLSLTARDMIKIGILYLQHGRWRDTQLVSSDYVADSTSKHNDGGPPTHSAYGYLWWTKRTKTDLDAFFAAGFGSQLIYVVPKLELVLALAADSSVPGGSVEFVNDIVLPAAGTLPNAPMCIARLGEKQPQPR